MVGLCVKGAGVVIFRSVTSKDMTFGGLFTEVFIAGKYYRYL
jgi:hypothetical protein